MKSKISVLITVILVLITGISKAQNEITFKLKNPSADNLSRIKFFSVSGDNSQKIDTAVLSSDYTCKLKLPKKLITGVYKVVAGDFYNSQFVLTEKDTAITVTVDFDDMKYNRPTAFNTENEAFSRVMQVFTNYKIKAVNINSLRRMAISKDSTNIEKLKKYDTDIRQFRKEHNQQLLEIKKQYPTTYSGSVLADLLIDPDVPDYEPLQGYGPKEKNYLQEHFFDTWNFRNENIINNPIISYRLHWYITRITPPGYDEYEKVIDIIMPKASANEAVKEFVLMYMLKLFFKLGPIETVILLNDKYVEGCSNLPVTPDIIQIIDNMKHVVVGSTAPDIVMNSSEGNEVKLSSLFGSKAVLICFWASTCSHCRLEVPEIYKVYQEYKEKGLKVYCVSLDTDKSKWLESLTTMGLNWINVCEFKSFKSEAVKKYFVYKTPALFLLDSKGLIVAKDLTVTDLPDAINKILK